MTSEDDSKVNLQREIDQLKNENYLLKTALEDISQNNIELKSYRKNLESILTTATFAWWEVNLETGNIQFSPLKAEMLGYSPNEFKCYDDFKPLLHPDDKNHVVVTMREYLNGSSNCYNCIYRLRTQSGEYKRLHDIGIITKRDSNGNPVILYGIVMDIADKVLLQDFENEDYNRFRLMIQSHNSIMMLIDAITGQIIDANKAAVEFYKYPIEQLTTMSIQDINISAPKLQLHAREQAAIGKQSIFEFPHKLADGTIKLVEVHSSPIEMSNRKLLFSIIHDITERKKIEDELKRNDDYLRKGEELGNYGHWLLSLNEKRMKASDGAIRMYGFDTEECSLEEIQAMALPEYRPILDLAMQETVSKGIPYDVEFKIRRKSDGQIIDVHSKAEIDFERNIIFGTVQDITERKLSEQALKASEEKYRLLAENASDVTWVYNLNRDEFSYISPGVIGLRGLQVSEAMQEKLIDSLSTESYAFVAQELQYLLPAFVANPQYPQFRVTEVQQPHKSGEMVWIEIASRFQMNSNGEVELIGVSRNVDERKRAESILKSQENFLRVLTNNLPGMVGYWTKDLICKFANYKYLDWFGLTGDDMIGSYLPELMDSEQFEVNKPEIERVLKGEFVSFERAHNFPGKSTIHTWAHYIPDIKDNVVDGFYVLVSDITEIKEAQTKLEELNINLKELNATKDRFFSIIAHDLKGPLGSFKDVSTMLADSYHEFTEEDKIDFLNLMKESSNNIYSLLKNLLEWSRSQSGVIPFNPQELNLKILSMEVTKLLMPALNKKSIKLTNRISAAINTIADPNMINTVLRNLISNAIKFTHESGAISLYSEILPNYIRISVSDTGVGIPKDKVNDIFKLGEFKNTPGTHGEVGTGLGLILCKEFIEKHSGSIWAESELDKGTTFYFTLPR